jgi:DNA-binding transcriptional LysR family regulator
MALHAVSGTELLFTGPRALVAPLCEPLGLATAAFPLPLPGVRVGAVWHPRNDADPAHQWLRDQVVGVLHSVLEF